MDTNTEPLPQKKNINVVKISRNGIIVFLRKNILLISFILIFVLSLLVGIWNIQKYETFNSEGKETDTKVLNLVDQYIQESVLGKNYFEVNGTELAKDLKEKITYIEEARVEKSIPNKITIFVKTYTPKLTAYLEGNKCVLLSEEGYFLEQVCLDSDEQCCKEYIKESSMYYFFSKGIDTSNVGGGKERLLIMEDISKIVRVTESFNLEIREVTLTENILTVTTTNDKTFTFTFSSDIGTQLNRYYVVMGKISGDNLKFKSLDLRFERPVMKN